MKDLLIGSAFVNDSELQRKWLELQLAFIRATTTEEFDHVVVVSGEIKNRPFAQGSKVIRPELQFRELGGSRAHQQSLNILADHFHRQKDDYRYFLIIDCDAFPIRKNWLSILVDKMPHHEIAALVRPENLEQRLHASVLFAKPEALDYLNFVATDIGYNMAGEMERDLNPPYYQEHRNFALSMVRSNKMNVHPIGCGVYFDMFYHHTNGSGCKYVENSKRYWDHVIPPTEDLFNFTDRLMNDPNGFIRELAGWNPKEYATVPW
jgi:hypothetical protein